MVEFGPYALTLARAFVQRWDVYARQLDDGRYACVHEPLHAGLLTEHLLGKITLGTYLLDEHSHARFIVLDADDGQGWNHLVRLARHLAAQDAAGYLEASRRGGHLWLFLPQAVPGSEARAFGRRLLVAHEIEGVELFPKQDALHGGPGSLARLPFGVHRKSGRRYPFLTPDGELLAPTLRRQIAALAARQSVPKAVFEAYRSLAPVAPQRAGFAPAESGSGPLSQRVKAAVGVMEFISRFVELNPTASGAAGLCPFHDDTHASFAVNASEGYWHCFAGCGGGSIIDFWMRWRAIDFTASVRELAEMLLQKR